jgi:hypothetical protein
MKRAQQYDANGRATGATTTAVEGPSQSTGRSKSPYSIWNGYGVGRVKAGQYAGLDSARRIMSAKGERSTTSPGRHSAMTSPTNLAASSRGNQRPGTASGGFGNGGGGGVSVTHTAVVSGGGSPTPYAAAEVYHKYKLSQTQPARPSSQAAERPGQGGGGGVQRGQHGGGGGRQFRPISAPATRTANSRPSTAQHPHPHQRQHPSLDLNEDEEFSPVAEDGEGFDDFAEEVEKSVGTLAKSMHCPGSALTDHQVTSAAGCVYYFNAPHRESDPSLAALKAKETEIDKRAMAVVAHEQLKRCVEKIAPGEVSRWGCTS